MDSQPMRSLDAWHIARVLIPAVVLLACGGMALAPGAAAAQQQERAEGRMADLSSQELAELQTRIQARDNRVIIGFKPEDRGQGVTSDGRPLVDPARTGELVERLGPGLVQTVERRFRTVPAVVATIDPDRLAELLSDSSVDYVEPDGLYEPLPVARGSGPERADGPEAAADHAGRGGEASDNLGAWGTVKGRDPVPSAQTRPWGIDRVRAPSAWSARRGNDVAVGIVDTGIDEDHPDLDPISGINTVTDGTSRSDWDDASPSCGSHGTHVAGSAAALDNSTGVVGVAPGADLHAIRVFDPESADLDRCVARSSDIVAGIEWAVDNGMDVINLSLGSSSPSIAQGDALAVAYSNGVLPVAAAGNDFGAPVGFPAAFPDAVAVGAIDENDQVADFSNEGPELEVAAPGVGVLSTTNDGGTGLKNGTSMASPHVAGAAALLRDAAPSLGLDEIRSVLRNTADPTVGSNPSGYDEETGDGVPDVSGGMVALLGGDNLAVTPSELELGAAPGGAPVEEELVLENTGDLEASFQIGADVAWLSVSPSSGSVAPGETATVTVTADPAGLSSRLHTGFLTLEGFENAPVEVRTRLAVAPSVPVDASQSTDGELVSPDDRIRYRFAGTAGQRVDVALIRKSVANDPILRVYAPDGETVVAVSDDAVDAALGFSSLVANLRLRQDGEYFIEVANAGKLLVSRDPSTFDGRFTLKVREAGPILGFSPGTKLREVAAREGGSPGTVSFEVVNLSGVGTLDWNVSTSDDWLTASPTSGTADREAKVSVQERTGAIALRQALSRPPSEIDFPALRELIRSEFKQRLENPEAGRWTSDPEAAEPTASTAVTLEADPAGFPQSDQFGSVDFSTTNNWLAPFQGQSVRFRIFHPNTEFLSTDLPFEGLDSKTDTRAFGIVFFGDNAGEIRPISSDGTVGSPRATATGAAFDSWVGLEQGRVDGDWFAIPNNTLGPVFKVDRETGETTTHVELPSTPVDPAVGASDQLYAPPFLNDQVYEVSPDGQTVTPLGDPIAGSWGGALRPQDGYLYVSALASDNLHRMNPSDGQSSVAFTVSDMFDAEGDFGVPQELEVGRSGTIYTADFQGRIWAFDPDQGSVELIAWTPEWDGFLMSLALHDGQLVITNSSASEPETYFLPVQDGPPGLNDVGPTGTITAQIGEAQSLRGDAIEVPLELDLSGTSVDVASYAATLSWDPNQLILQSAEAGDFDGSFASNQPEAGELEITSARTDGITANSASGGVTVLVEMEMETPGDIQPGTTVDMTIEFEELFNERGEDLLPLLSIASDGSTSGLQATTTPDARSGTISALCVAEFAWGDGNQDGDVSSADATQIQRSVVGLDLADGVDPTLFDVDTDGETSSADAVQILRHVTDKEIPASSRVDRFGVSSIECP